MDTVNNTDAKDKEVRQAYWKGHSDCLMMILGEILVSNHGFDRVRNDLHKLHKSASSKWQEIL